MTDRFRVVLAGRILPGHDPAVVRESVAQAFRLDAAGLDKFFSGRAVVVRRDASAEEAERLVAHIRRLGLAAMAQPLPAAQPAVPPTATTTEVAATGGHVSARNTAVASRNTVAGGPDELFSLALPSHASSPVLVRASGPDRPDANGIICPRCGEMQPRRTLCRVCGLDMPRYQAAKDAAEQEAREGPVAGKPSSTSRHEPVVEQAGVDVPLLGFSFFGRLGRLGYVSVGLLSWALLFAAIALSVVSGWRLLAGLCFVALIYWSLRSTVLRLHDTGRSGWMALLLIVPLVGAVLSLALLFMRGEYDDNDHGAQPGSMRGGAFLGGLVALIACTTLMVAAGQRNPEEFMKIASMMGLQKQIGGMLENDKPIPQSGLPTYAQDNVVVMYALRDCDVCEQTRVWLEEQPFQFSEEVLNDPRMMIELRARLDAQGYAGEDVQLPVVEVNGVLLPNNPSRDAIRRKLRVVEG